ncbi:MAG: 5-(carboxyamino)imidazole ribonucleotide mutase [Nitrososphaeraceae archaeon]
MGSDSDLSVMKIAGETLDVFDVKYELTIISAHRTPERLFEYSKQASKKGIKVIIAGAGGAAHLPGMIASLTTIPVIGVPIKTSSLDGLDSLFSIVQMPAGIPVATVAINGSKNAALLACQILAINSSRISKKILNYKNKIKNQVISNAKILEDIGFDEYLKSKK